MSFEDGLRLVKLRGESMQAAADAVQSGMVSVIGLDKEKVAALCEAATKEVSEAGNFPAPSACPVFTTDNFIARTRTQG